MNGKKIYRLGGIILLTISFVSPILVSTLGEPGETFNVQIPDFKADDELKFIIEGYQVQFAVAVNTSGRYDYSSSQSNNQTEVLIRAKDPGSYAISLIYAVTGPINLTIIHRSRPPEGEIGLGMQEIELIKIQRPGIDVELEYMAVVSFEATGEASDLDPDPTVIVEKTVGLLSLLPVHQFVLVTFFLIPFPMGIVAYRMTVPDKKTQNLPYENVKYRLYNTYLRILFFLNFATPIILVLQGTFSDKFFIGFLVFQGIVFGLSALMRRKARDIDLDYEERMLLKGYPPPDDKEPDVDKSDEEETRREEEI